MTWNCEGSFFFFLRNEFFSEFKVVSELRYRKGNLFQRFRVKFRAASANAVDVTLWKQKEHPNTSVHFKEKHLNKRKDILQCKRAGYSEYV